MNDETKNENKASTGKLLFIVLFVISTLTTIILFYLNFKFSELNQDEGWYLYAARLVSQGKLPYTDFAFTQGPVMAFVYSFVQPLFEKFGVAGGRLFTVILGFLTAVVSALLAYRLTKESNLTSQVSGFKFHPLSSAFIAFTLIGVNVYQSFFCTIVKTYALAGLLLALGFLALSFINGKQSKLSSFLAGVLIALAAGTRLSAILILPVVFLGLLVLNRRQSFRSQLLSLIPFFVGATITLGAVFGPFIVSAPESLYFSLFEYHAGRVTGGLSSLLVYKAGFISRFVQAYFVAIVACVVLFVRYLFKPRTTNKVSGLSPHPSSLCFLLWISFAVVTLLHFIAPFPYDDYQVMLFPLLSVALAVTLTLILHSGSFQVSGFIPQPFIIPVLILLLSLASAFSSPINQQWFVGEQDRIWWPLKKETSLQQLRRVSELLGSVSRPGDLLLTQDPYLAVEAGLDLPAGLELGPFSYFPELSREKAEKCHVLNEEMFIELIEKTDAPIAALSEWSFSIGLPGVTELTDQEQDRLWNALKERYKYFRKIDNFGHAKTDLEIYLRKQSN